MDNYLEKILDYLPMKFIDEDSNRFVKYLSEAFVENSENKKYQFAFSAFHMLNMIFFYKIKWFLFKQGDTNITKCLSSQQCIRR